MSIFALVSGAPTIQEHEVAAAVCQGAAGHLQMDPGTLSTRSAVNCSVRFATMEQHRSLTAPRRYRAEEGSSVVVFDGLPFDPRDRFAAYDAGDLLAHWDDLDDLEGQFCAVRVDLLRREAAIRTDTLDLSRCTEVVGQWVRREQQHRRDRTLDAEDTPDDLEVGSLLGIGWAVGDHALLRGIRVLRGGHWYAGRMGS